MTAPEDALSGGALDAWRIYSTPGRCTCGGTAPGFPQHEDFCGKPEDDRTCDDESPTLLPDAPTAYCELPAGHGGWHEGSTGSAVAAPMRWRRASDRAAL